LSAELRDRIDGWIAKQPDGRMTRAQAIRRLIERGLKAKAKRNGKSQL